MGIPLQNAETPAKKKGVKLEILTMTGKIQEVGIGHFYFTTENGEENFSSKASAAVYRCIDDYARTRNFITLNLDVTIEEPVGVIVGD